jgi:glucose/mannose transport system permease protein
MNSTVSLPAKAARPRRSAFTPARLGVYAFLLTASAFFLLPLYVMVITSLKTGPEVREAILFGWFRVP